MKGYIPRNIESVVRRAVAEFPVLVLTGPRQSGKTTLLKRMFGHDYAYVSLEPPDVRQAAAADPRGFLAMCPAPVIFDEVQYAPELFSYIKEQVDADRDHAGRYLLTGSQNLLLTQQISESLAGRAAMLTLLPLSLSELKQTGHVRFPWEGASAGHASESFMGNELWRNVLRGGYPELAASPERDVSLWFSAYVQTYLERDVRNLRQIGDLTQFQTFLRQINAHYLDLSCFAILSHGSSRSFFVWNVSILAHCDAVRGAGRTMPLEGAEEEKRGKTRELLISSANLCVLCGKSFGLCSPCISAFSVVQPCWVPALWSGWGL